MADAKGFLTGGEQTTINATITELFPALAFNTGNNPKTPEEMRQLVTEYFLAMEHVWDNTKEVYPDKEKNSYDCTEPFPWRYPGFLMERFVPFFIHANKLKKTEVPLVVLG